MPVQPEDKALLLGAVVGILGALGTIFTGDARYAVYGGILTSMSLVFKGLLPPTVPPKV